MCPSYKQQYMLILVASNLPINVLQVGAPKRNVLQVGAPKRKDDIKAVEKGKEGMARSESLDGSLKATASNTRKNGQKSAVGGR